MMIEKFDLKVDAQIGRASEYYRLGAAGLSAGDEIAFAWAMVRAASAAIMLRMPGPGGCATLANCFNDTIARHHHVYDSARTTPLN